MTKSAFVVDVELHKLYELDSFGKKEISVGRLDDGNNISLYSDKTDEDYRNRLMGVSKQAHIKLIRKDDIWHLAPKKTEKGVSLVHINDKEIGEAGKDLTGTYRVISLGVNQYRMLFVNPDYKVAKKDLIADAGPVEKDKSEAPTKPAQAGDNR